MRGGEDFEAAELPWILTVHWAWFLVAEGAEAVVRAHFHWDRWPLLNVLLLLSLAQAGWLTHVDQRSTALYWYVGDLVLLYACHSQTFQDRFPALTVLVTLAVAVIAFVSLFHFRRDMERYFKDTDDLDLNLSPGMIFFFNTLYFQSQFRWVSRFRSSDSLRIAPGTA